MTAEEKVQKSLASGSKQPRDIIAVYVLKGYFFELPL